MDFKIFMIFLIRLWGVNVIVFGSFKYGRYKCFNGIFVLNFFFLVGFIEFFVIIRGSGEFI